MARVPGRRQSPYHLAAASRPDPYPAPYPGYGPYGPLEFRGYDEWDYGYRGRTREPVTQVKTSGNKKRVVISSAKDQEMPRMVRTRDRYLEPGSYVYPGVTARGYSARPPEPAVHRIDSTVNPHARQRRPTITPYGGGLSPAYSPISPQFAPTSPQGSPTSPVHREKRRRRSPSPPRRTRTTALSGLDSRHARVIHVYNRRDSSGIRPSRSNSETDASPERHSSQASGGADEYLHRERQRKSPSPPRRRPRPIIEVPSSAPPVTIYNRRRSREDRSSRSNIPYARSYPRPAQGGVEDDRDEEASVEVEFSANDIDFDLDVPKALEHLGISEPIPGISTDSVPAKGNSSSSANSGPVQEFAIYDCQWVGNTFEDSDIGVRLGALSTPPGVNFKPLIRWNQLERPLLSFDEFLSASQNTLQLSEADRRHVRELLRKIEKDHEKQRQHGRDLEPNCEGDINFMDDDAGGEKQTSSTCFISLPFFTLQRLDVNAMKSIPAGISKHPARPLVQRQTRTMNENRELAQAIAQLPSTPKGHVLHVSSAWFLLVNGDTLLTCSSVPSRGLQGDSISIEQLGRDDQEKGFVSIRATNETQWRIPLEHVKTWPALVSMFSDDIFRFTGPAANAEFQYREERVTSTSWPSVIANASKHPIELLLSRRDAPQTPRNSLPRSLDELEKLFSPNAEQPPQIFLHGVNGSTEALIEICDALDQSIQSNNNKTTREQYSSCPEATIEDIHQWLQDSREVAAEAPPERTRSPSRRPRTTPSPSLTKSKQSLALLGTYIYTFFWPRDFPHPIATKYIGALKLLLEADTFLARESSREDAAYAAEFQRTCSHVIFSTTYKLAEAFRGNEQHFFPMPGIFYKAWLRLLNLLLLMSSGNRYPAGETRDRVSVERLNQLARIQRELEAGEKAMLLRIRGSRSIQDYEVCPTNGIAALLINRLCEDVMHGSADVSQTYSDYSQRLEAKIIENPLPRSHQETIRMFQQEVEAILTVLTQQLEVLNVFEKNIQEQNRNDRPPPFLSAIQDSDSRLNIVLDQCNSTTSSRIDLFRALQSRATELGEWHLGEIETNKDRQENAIMVFTIVTIIFLPLSFVAGVLGMNTYDIRNMNLNQWVYWAVALPLTVLVVGGSLWWVGAFEDIGMWFARSVANSKGYQVLDNNDAREQRFSAAATARIGYEDAYPPRAEKAYAYPVPRRRTTYPRRHHV